VSTSNTNNDIQTKINNQQAQILAMQFTVEDTRLFIQGELIKKLSHIESKTQRWLIYGRVVNSLLQNHYGLSLQAVAEEHAKMEQQAKEQPMAKKKTAKKAVKKPAAKKY
jgi:hypothetical protein